MTAQKNQFTIGCDPEFFLIKKEDKKLLSAIPFIKGTKWAPTPLSKGNIQKDNVAVEIATDPADTLETFIENIGCTLKEAVTILPKDTEIVATASAKFDEDQLQEEGAKQFGCDPDFDAWEIQENDPPYCEDATFRSCGAHIHVGTTGKDENTFLLDFEGKINMVKAMDCIHGIISTVLDCSKESIDRRKLYGKPGSHRPKEYGVEYRVLSNYWLKSPVTVMLMYHLTADALKIVREGTVGALVEKIGEEEIKSIIMNGKADLAMKMVETFILPLMSEDSVYYFNEALAKVKANDMNFKKEWNLYEEKGAE